MDMCGKTNTGKIFIVDLKSGYMGIHCTTFSTCMFKVFIIKCWEKI